MCSSKASQVHTYELTNKMDHAVILTLDKRNSDCYKNDNHLVKLLTLLPGKKGIISFNDSNGVLTHCFQADKHGMYTLSCEKEGIFPKGAFVKIDHYKIYVNAFGGRWITHTKARLCKFGFREASG